MELVWSVLPFVALLACPLMMVFCLTGMRKMGCAAPPATQAQAESQLPAARVVALQQQLRAIQDELTALQAVQPQAPRIGNEDAPRLAEVGIGSA